VLGRDGSPDFGSPRSRVNGGGASIIQQALAAGLVDELFLHVAPVILNGGTRLFEHLGGPIQLERAEVIESQHANHLRYRILK
jgi:dihydrofolate reductase